MTKPAPRIGVRPPADPVSDARVTVVIPCYNYAAYLPQAVQSAVRDQSVQVDVVVVDDASTDTSAQVARELCDQHPGVRLIQHPDNRGPVKTFNDGLREASGEFVVRLDADDLLTPGSLDRSVQLARAHPSVGLVYGHPLHFSAALPVPRLVARRWKVWPGHEWIELLCRGGANVITSPEVLMRRSVLDQVGGQRELAHSHDMEMWLRIASVSDVGYIRGADQAWHREHAASLSTRVDGIVGDLIERRAAFEVFFDGLDSESPEAKRLRCLAQRRLAREALSIACQDYDRGRVEPERIEGLRSFALLCWPSVTETARWRALERRRTLGDAVTHQRPSSWAASVPRAVRSRVRGQRWSRTGVHDAWVSRRWDRLSRVRGQLR